MMNLYTSCAIGRIAYIMGSLTVLGQIAPTEIRPGTGADQHNLPPEISSLYNNLCKAVETKDTAKFRSIFHSSFKRLKDKKLIRGYKDEEIAFLRFLAQWEKISKCSVGFIRITTANRNSTCYVRLTTEGVAVAKDGSRHGAYVAYNDTDQWTKTENGWRITQSSSHDPLGKFKGPFDH